MIDKNNIRQTFSVKRQLKSFGYAFQGIAHAFATENNMHIHTLASIAVIGAGLFFKVNIVEWCLLVFAITLVLVAEMLNTSLERLTDLVSPDSHPLAGQAKDVAAGAVTLSAIGAAIIGCLIFLPKILLWVKSLGLLS